MKCTCLDVNTSLFILLTTLVLGKVVWFCEILWQRTNHDLFFYSDFCWFDIFILGEKHQTALEFYLGSLQSTIKYITRYNCLNIHARNSAAKIDSAVGRRMWVECNSNLVLIYWQEGKDVFKEVNVLQEALIENNIQ